MGYPYFLLGLGILLYYSIRRHDRSPTESEILSFEVSVQVDGTAPIGLTDEGFVCATMDWWPPEKCDYGVCSWGRASLLNLDLENKILKNAVKAFSPLKIRMGGTLQDKLIYETRGGVNEKTPCRPFVKSGSKMFGFSQGCLPLSRWDQLNGFFNDTGAVVTFGLNALVGRKIQSDGLAVGVWDSSNAEALIRYTATKGYNHIYGWELGNELCGVGVKARVEADTYASDAITLHKLIQEIYRDGNGVTKPLVLAPGGFFDEGWFYRFITKANTSVQVITQHIYNLGPGVDTNLTDRILDPSVLDEGAHYFSRLRDVIRRSETNTVAWVGESGGAYNSGHHLVTDAFVMSFWYLDQLGLAASYDTKTFCRQTLIGGNYGLLNTSTFIPNPGYYSALLWHRLMGKQALLSTLKLPHTINQLRAYAHCSKQSPGITLLLLNLDRTRTARVHATASNTSSSTFFKGSNTTTRTRKLDLPGVGMPPPASAAGDRVLREEYHLTAPDKNLHSQVVLLNGRPLVVDPSSGDIPLLEPKTVMPLQPIIVAPLSVVFVHVPNVYLPACTTR